ncbi:MAG: hypothetical protein ACLSB9_25060 [Hydrogeniiclostridium mannosilyticum]
MVPVAMVPNFELSTAKARNVLPHVPYKDAVFNTAYSFLAAAIAKGLGISCSLWRTAASALPGGADSGFEEIVACGGNANPGVLSGAGPTMMALCMRQCQWCVVTIKPLLAKFANGMCMSWSGKPRRSKSTHEGAL